MAKLGHVVWEDLFPEEPQGTGSAFSCYAGTSVRCMARWSSVLVGFLLLQRSNRYFFPLQGLWNLLKVLGTSQRDFHQKAGTEKSMIWKGHQGSRRKAIEHLKGFSHLGGFALWDCLMEVCILTGRKLDESIQLNVQAGYRQKWRPPCKHWYHFVRAVDVTKDRSCVLATYKMKGRSICYNRSCHAISSPHPSLLPLSTTGKSPSNY